MLTADLVYTDQHLPIDLSADTEHGLRSRKPYIAEPSELRPRLATSAKPAALIERAKQVLEAGVGTTDGGACLAPDFEFCAAVVGPLGRDEYLGALGNFKLEDAFPDLNPNYYGFFVDPFEPHRVWFTSRSTGTHTGPLLGKPPTGKKLSLPPQQFHLDFAPDGLLREIGFYVVDRRQGNTGGLGGAFGYFYGTGNPLPIPECQPYTKSKRFQLLNLVGRIGARLKGGK